MAFNLYAEVFSPFKGYPDRVLVASFPNLEKAQKAANALTMIQLNAEGTRFAPVHQVYEFDIRDEP